MQETQRLALLEVSTSKEDIVDGIRMIRDSLITVEAGKHGGLSLTSPLLVGKTVNEAAQVLSDSLDGEVPEESRRLVKELIWTDDETGTKLAEFMDIHWQLDTAIESWEENQKHTEFVIDPDE